MTELDPTNKIVQKSTAKKPPVRPARPAVTHANTSAASDRVSLSHKPGKPPLETGSAKASSHIREQLVSKFREVLEEGTYKVKADEIAKKMVQKIQEEKDQTII